jgi:hypothetical protein
MTYEMILFAEVKKGGKWAESDILRTVHHDTIFMSSILFAFLAGVDDRCDNQRFKPKGLPENASHTVKEYYERLASISAAPSYLTLRELKTVDWENETVKLKGMIEKKRLDKIHEQIRHGNPDWTLVYPYALASSDRDDVHFELQVPVKFQFADFYEHVVKKLSNLGYSYEDARIVFWFRED